MQVISGSLPPHQATIRVGTRTYELDGSLSDAVRPGPWRPAGSSGGYSLFVRAAPPHPVYAVGRAGSPTPRISVVSDTANAETVRVRAASPAVVVRDVAWDAGWHASVAVNGGPAEPLAVAPHGLTEQVRLPAGTDLVTFSYRPPHWLVASSLSYRIVAVPRRPGRADAVAPPTCGPAPPGPDSWGPAEGGGSGAAHPAPAARSLAGGVSRTRVTRFTGSGPLRGQQ